MRAKLANGTFKKHFDALEMHGQCFIEGNSWNYSFFVPQNPKGLIDAINHSPKNVYVEKVLLKGKEIKDFILKHSEIMKGGKLTFYMSAKPKK